MQYFLKRCTCPSYYIAEEYDVIITCMADDIPTLKYNDTELSLSLYISKGLKASALYSLLRAKLSFRFV